VTSTNGKADLLRNIEQFLYREARYEDEHRYEDWEALWTDDGIYWVPANGDDSDPDRQMSIIYDNRSRIGLRVKQLLTGKRHTQEPQSRLRRLISNVELLGEDAKGIRVGANALVFETNQRGDTLWGARLEYVLRRTGDGDFKIAFKKVALVNNEKAIYTLSFLI
jgi:3-phenylpropionate/cinnamic acid dioxygenase small subunit